MKIINISDQNSLQNAADVLKHGGILLFPTDTVYGIGCLMDEKAIIRLYKIKNRPLREPTAILLTRKIYHNNLRSGRKSSINIPLSQRKNFLEGRVTIIFPEKMFNVRFSKMIIKGNKVGIRLPKSSFLEKLINKVGPIVATSANKKGQPAPARFEEINKEIIESSGIAIKTDEKLPGIPSRVYDLELKKYFR